MSLARPVNRSPCWVDPASLEGCHRSTSIVVVALTCCNQLSGQALRSGVTRVTPDSVRRALSASWRRSRKTRRSSDDYAKVGLRRITTRGARRAYFYVGSRPSLIAGTFRRASRQAQNAEGAELSNSATSQRVGASGSAGRALLHTRPQTR